MSKRLVKKKPIIISIMLILVAAIIFSGFQIVGILSPMDEGNDGPVIDDKTVVKDGVSYYPRHDITVFMLLGIDQSGPKQDSGSYNNKGQADFVSLVVFDESDKTYSVLLLNRDTMVDVPLLGVGGKPAGTIKAQLALAHNQGSGLEDSCENVKKALNMFLGNFTIDHYFSLRMDGISILNDAVGGVKVNVTDDFSQIDPTITKGEMVLKGEQALSYVRIRKDVGDQLNISRMDRHKEYMNSFFEAFKTKADKNSGFVKDVYESVAQDYVVSDCSLNSLSSLLGRYSDYTLKDIIVPEGTNQKGDEYMEFYVDEDKLEDLVLDMFYSKKK